MIAMWPRCRKLITPKKLTQFAAFIALILLFYLAREREIFTGVRRSPISETPTERCDRPAIQSINDLTRIHLPNSNSNIKTRQHVLLFLQDASSHNSKMVLYMLQAARIKYHPQHGDVKNLPALIDNNKGRYATIVFEDSETYLKLSDWNRNILHKYCAEYDVGIILFITSQKKKSVITLDDQTFGNFPLRYATNLDLVDGIINPKSPLLRVSRSGKMISGDIGSGWSTFNFNHSTYKTVLSGHLKEPSVANDRVLFSHDQLHGKETDSDFLTNFAGKFSRDEKKAMLLSKTGYDRTPVPLILLDTGKFDHIQKVIFGNSLEFWWNKILFLDALSYLSNGKLALPLERYIQVDIDDIFVSSVNTRMTREDVIKLIEFQENMRKRVPGFAFLLGFSGKFFGKGNEKEKEGDELMLKESHRFTWFPHMWSHMQAHLFPNVSRLCDYMKPNKEFAIRHKLNFSTHYAVAPHHAGVFPVHEPLYECWKMLWDIDITSTEEYPNLRPDTKRRGFIYKGIKVLPRQTCGLFTHTNHLDKYPGGPEKLNTNIRGGQLFQTVLLNQYNIFMTHFSNYGNDRLGLYVFDRLIDFVHCWTNLKITQISPAEMADKYFTDHSDEETPIWSNPCEDPRHLEIWAKEKSCDRLPKFVIIGPQKTGTTALHWFLQMHPSLQTSTPNPQTFEEVQFFNSLNYLKGIDWYMDFFQVPEQDVILYEKSANYFENSVVPQRLSALLPRAHVIILLVDPVQRAYSWYQHMRSHDDPTALNYSFFDVIRAGKKSPQPLLRLQTKCLMPGRYSEHIEKWMEYFSASQLILEDGELLRKKPVIVLNRLQKALGLQNVFNYTSHIKFDARKGFFCKVEETGGTKCLGKGKGRVYPEISEKSRLYLEQYYKEQNEKLLKILKDLRRPVPQWLSSFF